MIFVRPPRHDETKSFLQKLSFHICFRQQNQDQSQFVQQNQASDSPFCTLELTTLAVGHICISSDEKKIPHLCQDKKDFYSEAVSHFLDTFFNQMQKM